LKVFFSPDAKKHVEIKWKEKQTNLVHVDNNMNRIFHKLPFGRSITSLLPIQFYKSVDNFSLTILLPKQFYKFVAKLFLHVCQFNFTSLLPIQQTILLLKQVYKVFLKLFLHVCCCQFNFTSLLYIQLNNPVANLALQSSCQFNFTNLWPI